MSIYFYHGNELCHHGVKGQHWGERRYQNKDGSYKPGSEGRYAPHTFSAKAAGWKAVAKLHGANAKVLNAVGAKSGKLASAAKNQAERQAEIAQSSADTKNAIKNVNKQISQLNKADRNGDRRRVAVAAVGTALAVYGGYKLAKSGAFSTTGKKQVITALSTVGNHGLNEIVVDKRPRELATIGAVVGAAGAAAYNSYRRRR